MNAFHFLKTNRKIIFYVAGCISIMCKFNMIVKTIFFPRNAKAQVPPHSFFFPELIPFLLCAGPDKELHFHLFKFSHSENELPGNDLITKCFSNLSDTKRYLHPACFLNIQEIHKNALRSFRSQVNFICFICNTAELSGEHQVELPYVGPVIGTTD